MSIKNSILNLQYQYSKLFILGLNRKRFVVSETEAGLEAENNSRNTYLALVFTLFSCGLLFSGFIQTFVYENEITIEFVFVFWILHFVVGLIGLRQFLWLANGKHTLTISKCILTIDKSGTFLTKPKKFDLKAIERLSATVDEGQLNLYEKTQNNIRLNHILLFRHTYGQLTFDYKGKRIRVFSDLTQKEKNELTDRIEKEIKDCHQHSV